MNGENLSSKQGMKLQKGSECGSTSRARVSPSSVGTGLSSTEPWGQGQLQQPRALPGSEHLPMAAVSPEAPAQSTLEIVSNFIGSTQGRCHGMEKNQIPKP